MKIWIRKDRNLCANRLCQADRSSSPSGRRAADPECQLSPDCQECIPLRSPGFPVEMREGNRRSLHCATLRSRVEVTKGRVRNERLWWASPGFPVEVSGVEQLHTAFFERKPHTRPWLVLCSRNPGNAGAPVWICGHRSRLEGEACGIPHLAKNERDAPNFLYSALDRTACAPFIKERRMKFTEPTKLHRKSGIWGTHRLAAG
jgi:hypothetical protein